MRDETSFARRATFTFYTDLVQKHPLLLRRNMIIATINLFQRLQVWC